METFFILSNLEKTVNPKIMLRILLKLENFETDGYSEHPIGKKLRGTFFKISYPAFICYQLQLCCKLSILQFQSLCTSYPIFTITLS